MHVWFLTITSAQFGYSVTSIISSDFDYAMMQVDEYLNSKFSVRISEETGIELAKRQKYIVGEESTPLSNDGQCTWLYSNQELRITASLLPDVISERL